MLFCIIAAKAIEAGREFPSKLFLIFYDSQFNFMMQWLQFVLPSGPNYKNMSQKHQMKRQEIPI